MNDISLITSCITITNCIITSVIIIMSRSIIITIIVIIIIIIIVTINDIIKYYYYQADFEGGASLVTDVLRSGWPAKGIAQPSQRASRRWVNLFAGAT